MPTETNLCPARRRYLNDYCIQPACLFACLFVYLTVSISADNLLVGTTWSLWKDRKSHLDHKCNLSAKIDQGQGYQNGEISRSRSTTGKIRFAAIFLRNIILSIESNDNYECIDLKDRHNLLQILDLVCLESLVIRLKICDDH